MEHRAIGAVATSAQIFVEHHAVNHSHKPHPELSRPVTVRADLNSDATRAGRAGTQTIDHDWGLLKDKLPKSSSAKSPDALARLNRDLRAAQWLRMCSTNDRWPRFLEAVRLWGEAQDKLPAPPQLTGGAADPSVGPNTTATAKVADAVLPVTDGQAELGTPRSTAPTVVFSPDPSVPEESPCSVPSNPFKRCLEEPPARASLGGNDIDDDSIADEEDQEAAQHFRASKDAWGHRYFEPQAPGGKCGQHALNNLLGGPQYTDDAMAFALRTVLEELPNEPKRLHSRGGGWYSHAVLAAALQITSPPAWRLVLAPVNEQSWTDVKEVDAVAGVLCNIQNTHWTCIAKCNGSVFYVDSCHRPVLIDEVSFKSIVAQHPMSFMVVAHDAAY
jgi:hypothetical protein